MERQPGAGHSWSAETWSGSIEKAHIKIVADGKSSAVARAVGAPRYEETPPLTCWYFSYWSGVPTVGFDMYLRDKRAIFSFSTNDNLFAIFIAWPIAEFHSVKSDIEGHFMRAIDLVPGLSERVRSGRREERFYGSADLPSFLRRPFGPGWALVGDAGCHKDPFMALGICDAFRDADFLAAAVHEGLAGQSSFDQALMRYEQRRNGATMADYRENIARARFDPMPAKLFQLRAALHGNPEDTRRFIMAREGMIEHLEFFNAENLERILANARMTQLVPTPEAYRGVAQGAERRKMPA